MAARSLAPARAATGCADFRSVARNLQHSLFRARLRATTCFLSNPAPIEDRNEKAGREPGSFLFVAASLSSRRARYSVRASAFFFFTKATRISLKPFSGHTVVLPPPVVRISTLKVATERRVILSTSMRSPAHWYIFSIGIYHLPVSPSVISAGSL